MKILQPSKRSKRRAKSLGETVESSRSNIFSETFSSSNQDDTQKVNGNSDKSSLGVLHNAGSGNSLDNTSSSKRKRQKSKYKNPSTRNNYAQDLELAEKDSEYDFDASKLEAMPRADEFVPLPYLEGKKRRRSELESTVSVEPLELILDPKKKEFNELFARGVRLLSMREHSVKEITNKLFDKSDATDAVYAVVDELLEKKYLSDERFTESYIRARGNRGFGPVKIKAELKHRGVSSALIQDYLDESAVMWFDNAASQYHKKYGDTAISDYNAWSKRARFMQSRGFTMEHIHVTVPRVEFD